MFMSLTGYLLVFDQRAYWASIVAININGTAPILGPFIAEFLKVGPEFSQNTLSRFYSLHMLAVPGAIMALIGLHLYLVIRLGVTSPPWSKHRGEGGVRSSAADDRARAARGATTARHEFRRDDKHGQAVLPVRDLPRHGHVARHGRPDHGPRDHLARGLRLRQRQQPRQVARAASSGRPTRIAPTPAREAYDPRPEWYFFFLFQLLRIFKNPQMLLFATIIIPTL